MRLLGSTRVWGGLTAGMLSLCASNAETNRIILRENFESFKTTKAMRSVWPGGPGELMTNAPGGGQAAAHDGTGMNRRGGFFVFPDAMHNLVLQADFYDFGTNTDQNVLVSLNGEDTHDNVAFGLKGPYCYVARVGGFSAKTNWIPFKRGQLPVPGWHRFRATISASNAVVTLDLGIDGTVDRTLEIPFNRPAPTFTQLRFGGYSGKLSEGALVLVDNIKLEVVPAATAATEAIAAGQTETNTKNTAAAAAPSPPEVLATNLVTPPLPVAAAPEVQEPSRSNSFETATNPLQSRVSSNPPAAAPSIAASTIQPQITPERPIAVWWIGAALAIIIGLLGAVILMLRRETKIAPRALLSDGDHAAIGNGDGALVSSGAGDHWRQRALQAEAIAAKQAQILGEKVGPELVEFAKETLVQGLYTQRNALLETQVKAKQTLLELETRLSELHLPAQERVRAYEKRIAELEKQLESRDEEMRELTRATLLLVRARLEEERQQQGPRFN